MEEWKILNVDNQFAISTKGQIYDLKNEKYIKHFVQKNCEFEYPSVRLNKRRFIIARLVAETFIPNKQEHSVVSYKDKNRFNIDVSNLYWKDKKEFLKNPYFYRGKKIRCIETGETFNSIVEASRIQNVSEAKLRNYLSKKQQSVEGLHYEYC